MSIADGRSMLRNKDKDHDLASMQRNIKSPVNSSLEHPSSLMWFPLSQALH